MSVVLVLAGFLDAHAAQSALARAGDAPDDGPGVHVYLGDPTVLTAPCERDRGRPAGTRVMLGLARDGLGPGVRGLSMVAEALVCATDDTCVAPRSGTVVLDAVDDAGLRGRYTLDLAEGPVSGDFTAAWCAAPVLGTPVRATPVSGFDAAGREGQFVALAGVLVLGDQPVLAETTQETSPLRPAGTVLPLGLSAAMKAALQDGARVTVRGQLRGGSLVVHEVQPSP